MQLPVIPPIDQVSENKARVRQQRLTKPAGALGMLEDLSIKLAGITHNERPRFKKKGVIIMAADHGVAMEGVSAYPSEVTPQMVQNFLVEGAAVNVLARQAGATVTVVDIGVNYDFHNAPGMLHRKIARGSMNILKGPAMTTEQAEQAIRCGMEVVQAEIAQGMDLVATGEMGIGNTTPSSAITAVLTGRSVKEVTGLGTGIDPDVFGKKIQVIEQAIAVNQPDSDDAFDVLVKLGGLEIAGLVGVVIGAASRGIPVVVDGFISGAAALVAVQMLPAIKPYLIASHQSQEIGQRVIWEKLGLQPLLNLNLRVGEGTGSVLAFHIIEAAVRTLDEMSTFDEAGVSDKE